MTTPKRPTLSEIAERIDAHLKRFEADPVINRVHPVYGLLYFHSSACRSGNRCIVRYANYPTVLTRPEAERYLAWLDAGGIGKHWAALDGAERESAS